MLTLAHPSNCFYAYTLSYVVFNELKMQGYKPQCADKQ